MLSYIIIDIIDKQNGDAIVVINENELEFYLNNNKEIFNITDTDINKIKINLNLINNYYVITHIDKIIKFYKYRYSHILYIERSYDLIKWEHDGHFILDINNPKSLQKIYQSLKNILNYQLDIEKNKKYELNHDIFCEILRSNDYIIYTYPRHYRIKITKFGISNM